MKHARPNPPGLTADQLQKITAHGCTLPHANVISFPTADHFEIVRDLLAVDGVALEPVADESAKPERMTQQELLILSGWYRDQIHETRGF